MDFKEKFLLYIYIITISLVHTEYKIVLFKDRS